ARWSSSDVCGGCVAMTEASGYWERFWQRRMTRRSLTGAALAGGVGVGALALAGCGDDDDSGAARPATSTAVAQPKRGGTFTASLPATPLNLDPDRSNQTAAKAFIGGRVYS